MKLYPALFLAFIQLVVAASHPERRTAPLFIVYKEDRCGFIDRTGKVVVPLTFSSCEDFSEDYAPVEVGSKWGFIDRNGELTIAPQFDEVRWSFAEGVAAVRLGQKWGYIDKTGEFIIAPG